MIKSLLPEDLADFGGVIFLRVYIEYVLLDNIIIDYLLLKYTFILTKTKTGLIRLIFCAATGAIFAAILPLVTLPIWVILPIKALFSFCLVGAGGKFRTVKSYICAAAVFNAYTFILGGGVIGVFNLFSLPYDREYSIGLIVLCAYLLIKILHKILLYIYRRRDVYAFLSECEITLGDTKIKAVGFFDTGNRVYDELTSTPVVICSKNIAFKLTNGLKKKINGRYVQISTAIGQNKIFVFKIDSLKIYKGDKANIFDNVMLGISGEAFKENGYDLILHPELAGGVVC